MTSHRADMQELRSVMKSQKLTQHAAPTVLYTPRHAFNFPALQVTVR